MHQCVTHNALRCRAGDVQLRSREIVGMAASVCKDPMSTHVVFTKHLTDLHKRMRKQAGKVDGSSHIKQVKARQKPAPGRFHQPKWLKQVAKPRAYRR
jgi:hypothetical protein